MKITEFKTVEWSESAMYAQVLGRNVPICTIIDGVAWHQLFNFKAGDVFFPPNQGVLWRIKSCPTTLK